MNIPPFATTPRFGSRTIPEIALERIAANLAEAEKARQVDAARAKLEARFQDLSLQFFLKRDFSPPTWSGETLTGRLALEYLKACENKAEAELISKDWPEVLRAGLKAAFIKIKEFGIVEPTADQHFKFTEFGNFVMRRLGEVDMERPAVQGENVAEVVPINQKRTA